MVPPRPKLVPLEQRLKAKIERRRTIAVAPPTGTRMTVSVEEAAGLLGIGRDLCYRQVKAGTIPSLRWGNTIVVPVQGLLDLVEEATARAASIRQGAGNGWRSSPRNARTKTVP
jgi:excisionase family DNA binding protein